MQSPTRGSRRRLANHTDPARGVNRIESPSWRSHAGFTCGLPSSFTVAIRTRTPSAERNSACSAGLILGTSHAQGGTDEVPVVARRAQQELAALGALEVEMRHVLPREPDATVQLD